MRFVALSVNYHTASVSMREQLLHPELDGMVVNRRLKEQLSLEALAVLGTCNRVEFYMVVSPACEVSELIHKLLDAIGVKNCEQIASYMQIKLDTEAIDHLYTVAAGLDSMVLGESQILGQLKDAFSQARNAGTLDSTLDYLLRSAISLGKKVRTQTAIGHGEPNVAAWAIEYAKERLGSLEGRGILLMGAGKMGELAANSLAELRARVFIASRHYQSAQILAQLVEADAIAFDEIVGHADDIELIICSTASYAPIFTRPLAETMQVVRSYRPILFIDIAVPRDVADDVANVAGVTLANIDTLSNQTTIQPQAQAQAQGQEIIAAKKIIDEEIGHTLDEITHRKVAMPAIAALTQYAEALRYSEVEKALAKMENLDSDTRQNIELLSQSIVNKLLHPPIMYLRGKAHDPAAIGTLQEVFDLDS